MNKVPKILEILDKEYPNPKPALEFKNPLELLMAAILSAQCTDVRVNIITRSLFKKYQNAGDYANVDLSTFEEEIKSVGFFRNKAKSIIGCCKNIVERYGGKVPNDLEELTSLPGVGRKTANVVLGNAFGIPGITVDTHVSRVSQRLGLTKAANPEKIEEELNKIIPRDKWVAFSLQLIYHGRYFCKARKPLCEKCVLSEYCEAKKRGDETKL